MACSCNERAAKKAPINEKMIPNNLITWAIVRQNVQVLKSIEFWIESTDMRAKAISLLRNHWIILVICLVALYFRVGVGLLWDEGQLLHPDERFLAMVAAKIQLPSGLMEYLDSNRNPLSPYNNDFSYYVYGTLPLSLTKLIAVPFGAGDYEKVFVVGRILASVFDILTILGVYVAGCLLYGRRVATLSSLFLTLSVQNIQLSHFLGTENFVAAFVIWCFVSLIIAERCLQFERFLKARLWIGIGGILLGLGLASKISAAAFIPVALAGIFASLIYTQWISPPPNRLKSVVFEIGVVISALFCICVLLGFRFGQPSAFEGLSFFKISPTFTDNMKKIMELTNGGEWPPNLQWAGTTPVIFTLKHMMKWEAGYGFFFAWLIGCFAMSSDLIKGRCFRHIMPLGWTLLFLVYQSTRFVKYGRYLSIIYPFMALIAGYGVYWIATRLWAERSFLLRWSPAFFAVSASLIWAVMFTNIYREPHTRIRASRWMYANIPQDSVITNEAWDDGLPMRIDGKDAFGGLFKEQQLNLYEQDNDKKLEDIITKLSNTDYLVLSSNRASGTVPRLYKRFPMGSHYYKMLFEGRLGFQLVHSEVEYPSIFGFSISTDSAVESFTVYDHPKVLIFKRASDFNPQSIREELSHFPEGFYQPLPLSDTREVEWIYSLP